MSDTSLFVSYIYHLSPAVAALSSKSGPLNWCLPSAEIVSQSQAGPPKHRIHMNKIWLWHYTCRAPGALTPVGFTWDWGVVGNGWWLSGCSVNSVTFFKLTLQRCWLSLMLDTEKMRSILCVSQCRSSQDRQLNTVLHIAFHFNWACQTH